MGLPEDGLRCVSRLKPKLQEVINQGFRGEALRAAMTLTFAELLRERGGSDEPLLRAIEVFTRNCRQRLANRPSDPRTDKSRDIRHSARRLLSGCHPLGDSGLSHQRI